MAPIGLKLCQNAFQTIPDVSFFDVKKFFFQNFLSDFFFDLFFSFSPFSTDFGGARLFWTSKSSSWRHFAADGWVLRPIRGLEAVARSSDPRTGLRARPSYARFLIFLEAWFLGAWYAW